MSPALNCLRKRWSEVQKRRMSGISNSTMAKRSRPSLQAERASGRERGEVGYRGKSGNSSKLPG
jgi:hypothetical protein